MHTKESKEMGFYQIILGKIQANMNEEITATGTVGEQEKAAEHRYNGDETLPPTDVYIQGAIKEFGLLDDEDTYDKFAINQDDAAGGKNKSRVVPRLQLGHVSQNVHDLEGANGGFDYGGENHHHQSQDSFELPGQIKSPTNKSGGECYQSSAISSSNREQFIWERKDSYNQNLLYQIKEGEGEPETPNGFFTATHSERNQLMWQKSGEKIDDDEEEENFEELVYNQGRLSNLKKVSLVKIGHIYNDEDDERRIGRSKTTEIMIKQNERYKADGPEQLIELSDLSKLDHYTKYHGRRAGNYKEHEFLSEAKVLATTLQTDGNLMTGSENNQYTQRDALATERQLQNKFSRSSSLFGSIQLHNPLRSARNQNPKTFNDLRKKPVQQQKQPIQNGTVPQIPLLNCKQLVRKAIKDYFSSCIDGIFLRYIFCKAIPLQWYLVFMMAIDSLLAIIDASSMYNRIAVLIKTVDTKLWVGLQLALFFFAIKLVLYIPTITLTVQLIRTNKLKKGKWLYGIKLATFLIVFLFNFIALFFITKEGCNIFHATITHKSFHNQIDYSRKQGNEQLIDIANGPQRGQNVDEPKIQCQAGLQLGEIFGLFIYHFFSCWVILSTMHWIRRGCADDPTIGFLNLLQARHPNAIVSNHLRARPLVHSSQLQQKQPYRLATQTDSQCTPRQFTTMKTLVDEDSDYGIDEDDHVRLSSKQKDIHVNLKVAMKTLQDFKLDSQRSRLKKGGAKPAGLTTQKGRRPSIKVVAKALAANVKSKK